MPEPPFTLGDLDVLLGRSFDSSVNGGSQPLTQEMKTREKYAAVYGGVTFKRAFASITSDDANVLDYTGLYPLLTARNLVAGFAVPQSYIGTAGKLTLAQILEMQGRGMEFPCHSRLHDTPPASFDAFKDETSGAQADMIAAGINADSFVQPGPWTDVYNFDSAAKLESEAGDWLRRYFASASGYASDIDPLPYLGAKPAPARVRFGHLRMTIDTGWTIAQMQTVLDYVVNYGGWVEFACHFYNIGGGGFLSLADFTTLLTYLQTYQDAGKLDVLTPTAALYATKAAAKTSVIDDGDYTLSATGAYVYWSAEAGAPVIAAGGALSGNYVKCDAANYLVQNFVTENCRSLRFTGYCTSDTGAGTQSRVVFKLYDSAGAQIGASIIPTFAGIGAGQTKCVTTLGVPSNARFARIAPMLYGAGAAVRWSNVSLAKS